MRGTLELFPFPRCGVRAGAHRRMESRTCQRIWRRTAVRRQVEQAVRAWNWIAGYVEVPAFREPSAAQRCVLRWATASSELVEPPVGSKEAALTALLRADAGFELATSVGDAAAFKQGFVSFPDNYSDSPFELSLASTLHYLEFRKYIEACV